MPGLILNILQDFNLFTMAQTAPLVLRLAALSVNAANRAGKIIRDVWSQGDLGIVDKVLIIMLSFISFFKETYKLICILDTCGFFNRERMIFKRRLIAHPSAASLHLS